MMKYFMLIWLCINDPTVTLDNTCIQEQFGMTFSSLEECRMASTHLYNSIKNPDLYMTSFCSSKNLTTI